MIVTVATYQTTTGDTTWGPTVSARLEEAQERLEEVLDRPLDAVERSEVMVPYRDGSLSPRVTPVLAVSDGWRIDGDRLIARWPWPGFNALSWYPNLGPTIVYTGGWVERTANPAATNRLPLCISDDLCWAAWRLLHPVDPNTASAFVPGATTVQLGDAMVGFGPGGAQPMTGRNLTAVRWSRATLAYRFREERSPGTRGSRC